MIVYHKKVWNHAHKKYITVAGKTQLIDLKKNTHKTVFIAFICIIISRFPLILVVVLFPCYKTKKKKKDNKISI